MILREKPFVFIACLLLGLLFAGHALAENALNSAAGNPKLRGADSVLEKMRQGASQGKFIVMLKASKNAARDFSTKEGKAQVSARTAAALDAFLNRKNASEVGNVSRRFTYMPGFAASLTAEQLAALLESEAVDYIEENNINTLHLRQGVPLENALKTRPQFSGERVSVAIVDTGVDYNNVYLGGKPIGENTVVIGGRDFGLDKDDPMDTSGHGTSCAGIVAGTIGDTGDYIGGVAPGAKIYALKTSDAKGDSSDDAIIAAWEWSITHQDDAPESPIMIISVSLGSGYYQSACDDEQEALATAAEHVRDAGITLFVSAGNEGYCDGLGSPGCLSSVISVGAVYDAAFGVTGACVEKESCVAVAEPDCESGYYAEDTSEADKVTSYSDSASFLTLFAPADQCYTLQCAAKGSTFNTEFGGTSAACPYAAGAAAALQSAAARLTGAYLTPAQIKNILTSTGDDVTDPKASVTKPRVDLLTAINVLRRSFNLTPLDIPAAIRAKIY